MMRWGQYRSSDRYTNHHRRKGEYVKKETNDTSRREVVRLKVMLEIDSYKSLVLSDDSDAVS